MERNYDAITFIQKYLYFILRKPRAANFADIIKIATTLFKTTLTQTKLKELEIIY